MFKCLVIFAAIATATAGSVSGALAPLMSVQANAQVVPGKYIVVLKKGASAKAHAQHAAAMMSDHNAKLASIAKLNAQANKNGATAAGAGSGGGAGNGGANNGEPDFLASAVHNVYSDAIQGYSGTFNPEMLEKVRQMDEVAYVEPDYIARISAVQQNAPWNLARVSSRQRIRQPFNYNVDPNGGAGVNVYVLDTGINVQHQDFEGRAVWGASFIQGEAQRDIQGHGSHVAGTIGGRTFGVAKRARLIAVKVLDGQGQGPYSAMMSGIDWVVRQHRQSAGRSGFKGSVINMSLGGPRSEAMNNAAANAVSAGVHLAIAAGNESQNTCNVSPASAQGVMAVGATDVNDRLANFSNWGDCVDILAPGVQITSASNYGPTQSRIMSGTSMATPAVAGGMAVILSKTGSGMSPAQLIQKIKADSTQNAVSGLPRGTPNQLLFVNPN